MAQSLSDIVIHTVFSTKDRRKCIFPEIEKDLHAYLGSLCKDMGCFPYIIGGVEDHVHILLGMSRNIGFSKLLQNLKSNSSRWMKEQDSNYHLFSWQKGFGAFSVDRSNFKKVFQYIKNQKEHHKTRGFKEEFLLLLQRSGIEYDERYLWN